VLFARRTLFFFEIEREALKKITKKAPSEAESQAVLPHPEALCDDALLLIGQACMGFDCHDVISFQSDSCSGPASKLVPSPAS
jgi:hypothetical protein